MTFEIIAPNGRTHCSVLEFTAPEGTCYLPYWMMSNLTLTEGTRIRVKNVSLPKATFVKFQPQHVDFLEITNPRAVLEFKLRSFSCVTVGDQLAFTYNSRKYYLEVKEVQPQDAACIIEADVNVDFDAPVGYKEPVREPAPPPKALLPEVQKAVVEGENDEDECSTPKFQVFKGGGARLDGKALKPAQLEGMDIGGSGSGSSSSSSTASSSGSSGGSKHNWGEGTGTTGAGNMAKQRREQALAAAEARMGGSSTSSLSANGPTSGKKSGTPTKWSKMSNKKFLTGSGHRLT